MLLNCVTGKLQLWKVETKEKRNKNQYKPEVTGNFTDYKRMNDLYD